MYAGRDATDRRSDKLLTRFPANFARFSKSLEHQLRKSGRLSVIDNSEPIKIFCGVDGSFMWSIVTSTFWGSTRLP
jgi:hypothetical protein